MRCASPARPRTRSSTCDSVRPSSAWETSARRATSSRVRTWGGATKYSRVRIRFSSPSRKRTFPSFESGDGPEETGHDEPGAEADRDQAERALEGRELGDRLIHLRVCGRVL